jgi:glycosyltransferase involved in cell wall biosynthesis
MISAAAPSVSVVIPCHRAGRTLARTLRSVAAQVSGPAEVILVDDGNADDERALLDSVARDFAKLHVRVIRLAPNAGAAAARNAGWDAATGDLVAFLDADDVWHPRKLEVQGAFLGAHPEFALCGHRAEELAADEPIPEVPNDPGWREITPGALLFANRFITPSVMLRRDLPLRFRTHRRYMEDHLLWLEIAYAGHRIARLDAVLAYTFKPAYGWSGLSSNLWAMEKGELDNYRILREERHLGRMAAWFFYAFSLVKFAKRVLLTGIRRGLSRARAGSISA